MQHLKVCLINTVRDAFRRHGTCIWTNGQLPNLEANLQLKTVMKETIREPSRAPEQVTWPNLCEKRRRSRRYIFYHCLFTSFVLVCMHHVAFTAVRKYSAFHEFFTTTTYLDIFLNFDSWGFVHLVNMLTSYQISYPLDLLFPLTLAAGIFPI